ncbi:MAG: peptidoglycan-binding protein [Candidatus Limiplasma sp.]|nr:peptidoglycan-binding protein [Candidatus Limiplasma sp.]
MKRALSLGMALVLLMLALGAALPAWGEEEPVQTESYQPLQYGDQGEDVSRIQQRLTDLGYYSGKVSGNFLDGTRAAVMRFQKDYGLKETGIADGQTEALLMSAEYRALSMGSEGEDVKRLQEHLADLGYYKAKLSGRYLEATTGAVKVFQERNGLTATGEADVQTQQLLFSGKAVSKDGPATTQPPDPDMDVGDINDVVMVEDGADNQGQLKDIDYSKKLTRGAKGQNVKQVQQKLTELGYFDGPISGNYMTQTMDAVKKFQVNNGIKADGITGEETWNLLFNDPEVLDVSATPRPTPVPTPVPYAITVDVRNQVVLVNGRDEAGEYTVPVKRMICSTGMKATPSDVGDWVLDGRKARWCYFPAWGSHAQYWTRINPYIAFHSVIYRAVDTMALSVKSYNMLGSRASHGCIRLLVNDAKWIYDNVGEGVVVTIREDLPEDQELTKALQPPPLNRTYMRPSNTPEPTAEPNYSASAAPPQPFRTLKKGKSGEDVYWLQRKLQDLGYYTGTATGSYYNGTHKAVKAFQKDHGINADGIAGEQTLNALYADVLNTPLPEGSDIPAESLAPSRSPEPTWTLQPSKSPEPSVTPVPTQG